MKNILDKLTNTLTQFYHCNGKIIRKIIAFFIVIPFLIVIWQVVLWVAITVFIAVLFYWALKTLLD